MLYKKQLNFLILVGFILFAASCVSLNKANYTFNKKFSVTEAKQDFILLQKILEANHPSLYWYTSKDSLDNYFNTSINSIVDSISENDFKNKVAYAVSKIRCGHTSVRTSTAYNKLADKNRFPQFPLFLKVWDDSLVVLANANSKDSILKRGTIVTSINGQPNNILLAKLFDVISTDGYSNNYKCQVLSNNFPAWYKSVFGLDSLYTIKYIDSLGTEKITVVKSFSPIKDTTKNDSVVATTLAPQATLSKRQRKKLLLLSKRSMLIDTSINTAYIRLTTFSGSKLRKFFRQSFKQLKQKKVENLVIDLRENGGGNVALSNKLTKYLIDSSFKNGDTVAAINRSFTYKKHIRQWWLYWFPMHLFSRKKSDGKYHFTRFENHYYKPKQKNHFYGNVYLIQGGVTFSASTMFTSALKGQKNITLVGEETGGGYYGNSAMNLLTIELPITQLRIVLPMYRLVMDKNRPKGRGVMPDVYIKPSSVAIKKGIDIKLAEIRKMILDKRGRK